MGVSKNIKKNKGQVDFCSKCKKEVNMIYEAYHKLKPNGAYAFKVKLVRLCCNS